MGSHVLPANLLQCRVTAFFRHIHLLHHGVLHRMQEAACLTRVFTMDCSNTWNLLPSFTDPDVCRVLSLMFSLFSCNFSPTFSPSPIVFFNLLSQRCCHHHPQAQPWPVMGPLALSGIDWYQFSGEASGSFSQKPQPKPTQIQYRHP